MVIGDFSVLQQQELHYTRLNQVKSNKLSFDRVILLLEGDHMHLAVDPAKSVWNNNPNKICETVQKKYV